MVQKGQSLLCFVQNGINYRKEWRMLKSGTGWSLVENPRPRDLELRKSILRLACVFYLNWDLGKKANRQSEAPRTSRQKIETPGRKQTHILNETSRLGTKASQIWRSNQKFSGPTVFQVQFAAPVAPLRRTKFLCSINPCFGVFLAVQQSFVLSRAKYHYTHFGKGFYRCFVFSLLQSSDH